MIGPEQYVPAAETMCRLADAARAFANADYELETAVSPDPGVVVASMVARHNMRLLCGLPCGCEESTCEGLLS